MSIENIDASYNVIKHDLSRFLPIRIIIKEMNGKICGKTEESFSLGYESGKVRIWWSGKAYSILGEHNIDGRSDAEYNIKEGDIIVDPLSSDCPVEVDWAAWLSATTKYGKRNAPFKMKHQNDEN